MVKSTDMVYWRRLHDTISAVSVKDCNVAPRTYPYGVAPGTYQTRDIKVFVRG